MRLSLQVRGKWLSYGCRVGEGALGMGVGSQDHLLGLFLDQLILC